jgi:hypothetical protein
MLAASNDTGRTWEKPIEISSDETRADQSNPGVAVASDGSLLAVWNDRRHDTGNRCFVSTVAASVDGGLTFSRPAPLATKQTCPVPDGQPLRDDTFGGRFYNGGETQGIAALGPGRFLVTWIDGINGKMQLRASRVSVSSAERN